MPAPFPLGLVSVTFRQKSIEDVIDLVVRAKLDAIEWAAMFTFRPATSRSRSACGDE